MLKKIIFILIAGAAITGVYVYKFVINKEHPDFAELKADYSIEAQQLYIEFVENADASASKYNGKMIELSGEVNSIETSDSLLIAVYVFNEGMFGDEGVRCTFLRESAGDIKDVTDLTNRKIKGFCSGYNDTDVILEKCSLTK